MPHPPAHAAPSSVDRCSVVELRRYTLHPGRRDALIDLFDRHFRDGLAAAGMHVIGEFRDLDDPDRFVWLRGFRDMPSRAGALRAFYEESDVWRAHRDEANATMVDSDDVLLLRPVHGRAGCPDMPPVTDEPAHPLVVATICQLRAPADEDLVRFFESRVAPVLTRTGARLLACFATEPAENNYPRLPVRTGENVFVWLSSFAGRRRTRSTWTGWPGPTTGPRERCPN